MLMAHGSLAYTKIYNIFVAIQESYENQRQHQAN